MKEAISSHEVLLENIFLKFWIVTLDCTPTHSHSLPPTSTHSHQLQTTPIYPHSLPSTPTHFHPFPLIFNRLPLIFIYMLKVCTGIRTVRFTNLSVLTINAFNVPKFFTFLLLSCAYVLTSCLHVSHVCQLDVSFLICSMLFFLFVIIYRHILKPRIFTTHFRHPPSFV